MYHHIPSVDGQATMGRHLSLLPKVSTHKHTFWWRLGALNHKILLLKLGSPDHHSIKTLKVHRQYLCLAVLTWGWSEWGRTTCTCRCTDCLLLTTGRTQILFCLMKNMLLVHVSLQHGRVGVLVWAGDTVLACVSHMVHATQKWAPNVKTVLTQHLSFNFYFCTFFLCSLASVTCCLWLLVVCLDKYRKQVSWKDICTNLFYVYQKELWISHLRSLMFEPRQFLCCKLKPQWIILVAFKCSSLH